MKNTKIRWITRTAVLLALLVVLQAATKSFGQLVTGSCVNAVLGVAAGFVGLGGGLVVALASPWLAYLLGIAPQIVTVPAIMIGNAIFVIFMSLGGGEKVGTQIILWILAAVAKFVALYLLVVKVICGVLAPNLMSAGVLKQPMLTALPATFAWPQLITALIGGAIALVVCRVLKKAIKQ